MAKVISIELDTNLDPTLTSLTLEQYLDELRTKYDVLADVVNPSGPGGGAPVVQYTGKVADVERMVYDEWTSCMDQPIDRLSDVAFMVHGEE